MLFAITFVKFSMLNDGFLLCLVESQGPLGQRTSVICLKNRATPKKYPRLPGIPTKTPL